MKKKEIETSNNGNPLSCGCGCCGEHDTHQIIKVKSIFSAYLFDFIKIIISLVLLGIAMIIDNQNVSFVMYVCAFIVVGYDLMKNFVKNSIKLCVFNESALMLIASVTAFILGDYFEGVFIVLLFSVGELLEGVSTAGARKRIADISKLKMTFAHVITKDGMKDVEPESVPVGSIIEVKKGESVPIDGVLLGSNAVLDVKAITGESLHSEVKNCGEIYSGSINVGESFVMKTTKKYCDSTVEKIVSMVDGALTKKAKTQKFITSFARIYTPTVVCVAFAVAFIPPLFDKMNFVKWIYKALSFLVVSCPCALVISVPLAFYMGIGCLAKKGILVKGSNCVDLIAKTTAVAFDKTGTLTKGELSVCKIETEQGFDEDEIFGCVVALEKKSTHPIAKTIVDYDRVNLNYPADNVSETLGKGISGVVNGKSVSVGNFNKGQTRTQQDLEGFCGVALPVYVDGVLAQTIYLKDEIKDNAKETIQKLKQVGVEKTYLLSGDSRRSAMLVGKSLGVDEIKYELLPEEKLNAFKDVKEKAGGSTVFVGDGINDAPTLAIADVGVAMGGLGSDLAAQSSDVIIMDDDVGKLPQIIKKAKKIKRVVYVNIIGSLLVKFLIMAFGLFLSVPVWVAMLGDVGLTFVAIINSITLGRD